MTVYISCKILCNHCFLLQLPYLWSVERHKGKSNFVTETEYTKLGSQAKLCKIRYFIYKICTFQTLKVVSLYHISVLLD